MSQLNERQYIKLPIILYKRWCWPSLLHFASRLDFNTLLNAAEYSEWLLPIVVQNTDLEEKLEQVTFPSEHLLVVADEGASFFIMT